MINVYGLKNCDTCRKAWKWLEAENIDYIFFDIGKNGINETQVTAWAKAVGWEILLNKRGTTWRAFNGEIKSTVDEAKAIKLMTKFPAVIKRPVFELAHRIIIGFGAKEQTLLKA